MSSKYDRAAVIKAIRAAAPSGGKLVFVYGNFNIVHPGHLRLLRFASECGDYLAVGVLGDQNTESAILKQNERLAGVDAISWVNYAFIMEEAPEGFIAALRPDVVVKGSEYKTSVNPEFKSIESYGGQLLFGSGDTSFSSLELIQNERNIVNHSAIKRPTEFMQRHGFSDDAMQTVLDQMAGLRVLVIGDTIVDEYVQCDPLGMSQEDPTNVVTPIMTDKFVGGAGIVASHASGLGAKSVDFISVIGDDVTGEYAAGKLASYGLKTHFLIDDSRPTTLKQRYRAGNKTLLRVSHLRQHKISETLQQKAIECAQKILAHVDLVVFSDFNYGVLTQPLVDQISAECQRRGIMMVADSQSSSQVGDVSRFNGAALLTPTEREARIALGNYEDGLVIVARKLRDKANAENIIITLGAEGILIYAKATQADQWHTDRLDALNSAPKDPAGAGDCLLVCAAMSMALGRTIWESLYLGSLAAACQVGRIGNTPLSADELRVEMSKSNIARKA